MNLCSSVDKVNNLQREIFFNKIKEYFKDLKGLNISIWGLSFKPNTDDIREAPSINVINNLLDNGANISVNDPVAMDNFKKVFGDKIKYSENNYEILENSDCLVINTEWSVYRQPDFDLIKKKMKKPIIFDGRNLYNPQKLKSLGFYYSNVGFTPDNE